MYLSILARVESLGQHPVHLDWQLRIRVFMFLESMYHRVMLTALPVLILSTKGTKPPSFPQPLDILGLSVWILGFATEVGNAQLIQSGISIERKYSRSAYIYVGVSIYMCVYMTISIHKLSVCVRRWSPIVRRRASTSPTPPGESGSTSGYGSTPGKSIFCLVKDLEKVSSHFVCG
jgi:hypothetical protein